MKKYPTIILITQVVSLIVLVLGFPHIFKEWVAILASLTAIILIVISKPSNGKPHKEIATDTYRESAPESN